ncbi:hypothetical protein KAI65_06015 [Candidatus Parcubacteria bacterium]|nr:hypothetical protein [Candidatus Parcubacteria bacterium]
MSKLKTKEQINIPKIGVFTIVITWIILLSMGIKAEIAFRIGGICGITVVAFLAWMFWSKSKQQEKKEDKYINTFVRGPSPYIKKDSAQINDEKN